MGLESLEDTAQTYSGLVDLS
jgi:hypothetical protein